MGFFFFTIIYILRAFKIVRNIGHQQQHIRHSTFVQGFYN